MGITQMPIHEPRAQSAGGLEARAVVRSRPSEAPTRLATRVAPHEDAYQEIVGNRHQALQDQPLYREVLSKRPLLAPYLRSGSLQVDGLKLRSGQVMLKTCPMPMGGGFGIIECYLVHDQPRIGKTLENSPEAKRERQLLGTFGELCGVVRGERSTTLLMPWYGGDLMSVASDMSEDTVPAVLSAIMQTAEGLRDMHAKRWVHGDVKPDNIFIDDEGRARLGDFGLSRRFGDRDCSGTLLYIAPEAQCARPQKGSADIYSLGESLKILLRGRRIPNRARSRLSALIGNMTQAAPNLRPSAQECVNELAALQTPAEQRRGQEALQRCALRRKRIQEVSNLDLAHGFAALKLISPFLSADLLTSAEHLSLRCGPCPQPWGRVSLPDPLQIGGEIAYEGRLQSDRRTPDGFNLVNREGLVERAFFHRGRRQGAAVQVVGDETRRMHFVHGQLHGLLTIEGPRGYVLKANMRGNLGHGEEHVPKRGEHYRGDFFRRQRRGVGELSLANDWRFEGTFEGSPKFGTLTHPNGARLSVNHGRIEGPCTLVQKDGTVLRGQLRAGQLHGRVKLVRGGRVQRAQYRFNEPVTPPGVWGLLTCLGAVGPQAEVPLDALPQFAPGWWNK